GILYCGEKKLTGSIAWDLTNASDDSSITERASVQHSPDYKNPFYGGLYSLILPGAGQYNSGRYTKAAIFITAEVALIVYSIINNNNGDKKTQDFQNYANRHWSAMRYAKYIEQHGKSDYGPTDVTFTQADYDAISNRNDFSKINLWEQGTHLEGFSHQLPQFGEQQYYELIGKYNQFKFGWDTYPQDANGVPVSDRVTTEIKYDYDHMVPQQMLNYAGDRGKANDYYYAASFAVSAIVINHVVSAVDAFLSTKHYNNELASSMGLRLQEIGGRKELVSELRVKINF
ncbi:MAG: hypothetical protein PHP42_02765, partial [Bacteroidota bacterium]|nr:hypothetical protein [Bacteroidota bacterium]